MSEPHAQDFQETLQVLADVCTNSLLQFIFTENTIYGDCTALVKMHLAAIVLTHVGVVLTRLRVSQSHVFRLQ